MYTQNIDGFERCKFLQHFRMVSYIKCELVWLKLDSLCVFRYVRAVAGIPEELLVEAHGSFSTATCLQCRHKYKGIDIEVRIQDH